MIKMTRGEAKRLREVLDEQLATFGVAEPDYDLRIGRATFDEGSVTLKVTIAKLAECGLPVTPEAQALDLYDGIGHSLGKGLHGRGFTDSRGTKHRIVGFKPRASKKPFITQDDAGNQFVWPETSIVRALQTSAK